MRILIAIVLMIMPQLALASGCGVDTTRLDAQMATLQRNYGDVLSDISCDAPTIRAHVLMCDSSYESDDQLWKMGIVDTRAAVYARENATGRELDHDNPPLDETFIAQRDACNDVACLCKTLIGHTDDSLGGLSPYARRRG